MHDGVTTQHATIDHERQCGVAVCGVILCCIAVGGLAVDLVADDAWAVCCVRYGLRFGYFVLLMSADWQLALWRMALGQSAVLATVGGGCCGRRSVWQSAV